ncbi:hypothetical protein Q0590_30485 [Rhodocytophaga aerolata]|uniref:Uncharacterized protein n=1 Tax=Rhodocytophaga aerolata TaxID=455078 RepID=A0ABT8RIL1_9BACT|nr:hypothetical protein [Rhodocytophaga aerolata]MDO1450640.1 hypothetical protein [Rhodocytophaga aerolata]
MSINNYKSKALGFFILIICLGTVSLPACNSRRDNDLRQEHANTYLTGDELEGYKAWTKEQEEHTKMYQYLLAKADDRIDLLKEQMDSMSVERQAIAREDINRLETRQVVLENKLQKLKQANEQNWAELKKDVEGAADSLNTYIENLDKNVEFGAI